MTKKELRCFVRQQKESLSADFPIWSAEICRKIMDLPVWQKSRVVLLYHALPDEPDLQSLMDAALACGKYVLLPVVDNDDILLKPYEGMGHMQKGAFGIYEPSGTVFPQSRYAEIELALIPGMAFDQSGHRLGRGRGYYDRFLPRITQAYKLGVCFPFQLLDDVPHESHDIPVDGVMEL